MGYTASLSSIHKLVVVFALVWIATLSSSSSGSSIVTVTAQTTTPPVPQFVPIATVDSKEPIIPLPEEFQIGYGPFGLTLMFSPSSSSNVPIYVGGSRPEFRIVSSSSNTVVVLGYPREMNPNQLHLPITKKEKEILAIDGLTLEVWKSGKRLDMGGKTTTSSRFSNLPPAPTSPPGGGSSYNSIPPNTPTININPAARGNYTTRRLSYNLPPLNVTSYVVPLEVVAEVTQPRGIASTIKSPLILFLHGRHATCYIGGPLGFADLVWPCSEGYSPIPSHLGYRYVADQLASQGYVVVSISANSINAQDGNMPDSGVGARSRLIRHHLSLWSTWNRVGGDPWNNTFVGKLDMNKVVLVGHSRGGEGVNRAAIDATPTDPYKIIGLVSYGPTAFGEQVTPDIHSATILPTCDGDVSDLQGQLFIDRSRDIAYSESLRSAVIALGANHNYFNTEWTPGLAVAPSNDDWWDSSDPVCGDSGSVRLTAQEQQIVGSAYTVALVRLAVNRELAMLPLLDGSFVKPVAIGSAEVAVSAIGGAGNLLLYRPGSGSVTFLNGMSGKLCAGSSFEPNIGSIIPPCGDGSTFYTSPHFTTTYGVAPPTPIQELQWTSNNSSRVRINIPTGSSNLTKYDWINLRVANDPNNAPVRFSLQIRDTTGKTATIPLTLTTIDGWPGTGNVDRLHARTLRGRLRTTQILSQVNLSRVSAIILLPRTATGRVWIFDISVSQNLVIQPTVLNLPSVSVDSLIVQEGNGPRQATLRVRASPAPVLPGVVWIQRSSTNEVFQVNITPGSSIVSSFNVSWNGNSIYDQYQFSQDNSEFKVFAVNGVVTGNYIGGYTIVEDDPIPILSGVPNNVTVSEGQLIRWTLRLSTYSSGISYSFKIVPPIRGNELYSDDVDQAWLQSRAFYIPNPPIPLSQVGFNFFVSFDYGEQTREITIPIINDRKSEGIESVRLELDNGGFASNPSQPYLALIGIVRAN